MSRETLVDSVIANCKCGAWTDGDRDVLNSMTDAQLASLNAAAPVEESPEEEATESPEEEAVEEKKMSANLTYEQWIAQAPTEVVANVQHAGRIVEREKRALVTRIIVNISDPKRRQTRAVELMKHTYDDLVERVADLPAAAASAPPVFAGFGGEAPVNNQWGLTENEQADVLDIDDARKSYDPLLMKRA